jgi:hypothetical protein
MRLLESLEASTELGNVDFHLFQDGAVNIFTGERTASDAAIAESIRVFERSSLPRKKIHEQEGNVGIGIIQLRATDYLAEHYSRIIVIENDTAISPYFLGMAPYLFDDLEDQPDTFSFNPGFRRMCSIGTIRESMTELAPAWNHWNCECFLARNWARIRHLGTFEKYHELICNVDYPYRMNSQIRELFTRTGWRADLSTTQDNARNVAIHEVGMKRMALRVNRALNIGRTGLHLNPAMYRKMKFDGQAPYVFESDATRKEFTWLSAPLR